MVFMPLFVTTYMTMKKNETLRQEEIEEEREKEEAAADNVRMNRKRKKAMHRQLLMNQQDLDDVNKSIEQNILELERLESYIHTMQQGMLLTSKDAAQSSPKQVIHSTNPTIIN